MPSLSDTELPGERRECFRGTRHRMEKKAAHPDVCFGGGRGGAREGMVGVKCVWGGVGRGWGGGWW